MRILLAIATHVGGCGRARRVCGLPIWVPRLVVRGGALTKLSTLFATASALWQIDLFPPQTIHELNKSRVALFALTPLPPASRARGVFEAARVSVMAIVRERSGHGRVASQASGVEGVVCQAPRPMDAVVRIQREQTCVARKLGLLGGRNLRCDALTALSGSGGISVR